MITVGITAFREGKFLREAWNSILSQTYKDWQAIIVLDGGADEQTRRIFKEINDSRLIKIELEENIGPYPARNLAIEHCKTEVYCFLDADDYLAPDALEQAVEKFKMDWADYLCVGVELFWENGKRKYISPRKTCPERFIRFHEYPGMIAFRKSIWRDIGGYSIKLKWGKADFDFILSLLELNYKPALVDSPIYFYRQKKTGAVSKTYGQRMGRVYEIIINNHPITFSDDKLKRDFLHQGYHLSAWHCYQSGHMLRAAYFAQKGIEVGPYFDYWPLNLANKIPKPLLFLMVGTRRQAGKVFRAISQLLQKYKDQ